MGKDGENNVAKIYRDDDYDPSFRTYMYNPKTGQVFGRTGLNWAKLTVFYLIFYAALASFTGLYFYLFSLTLNEDAPKWTLDKSLIGTNPGMGYRPMPDRDTNSESSLIWYERNKTNDAKFWYKQLEEYIDLVENPTADHELINCNYNGTKATKHRSCRLDTTGLTQRCNKNNKFGYPDGEPCILLKLNKIFGWEPKGYGIKDGKYDHQQLIDDLDHEIKNDGMSEDLKTYILTQVKRNPNNEVGLLSTIWMSCSGETVSDQENIGAVAYYPTQGIPGYYFPYYKQKGYQSPFIFVQLLRPKKGSLINVECKAWAKNIFHDRTNRLGSVHFELMID